MKKDSLVVIFIVIFGLVMYGLTLHGVKGNPTANQFKDNLDQATMPFELSPERGRYVHVANMAESGIYNLSTEWGGVAYPDVGISTDGKISSYFAPGVAYMTLPFYKLGAKFGYGQLATFAVESIVSIITLVFIYIVGRRIFKLPMWAALFSVLVFAFASTSWSYAVTLYQNAFTACFMITSFYAVWRFAQEETRHKWLYASYVWSAYALSITVDYPNAVMMLPVMFYFAISTFKIEKIENSIKLSIKWSAIVTFVVFVLVTSVHFWHNAQYYGGPTKLAGELQGYNPNVDIQTLPKNSSGIIDEDNKSAVGFFSEEKIPRGLYVLLVSDERGLFYFTPIFIFSIFGILYSLKRREEKNTAYIVPIALIIVNVFLYSSWGDPWGGWAYGPRYLIPTIPYLALFIGLFLSQGESLWKRILIVPFFLFSSAVALLGVLTTNAVPTKSEAALLAVKTYNFLKNIPFIMENRSSSFAYNQYFSDTYTLFGYFLYIFIILAVVGLVTLFVLPIIDKEKQNG